LNKQERINAFKIILVMLIMAIIEMVGIASILPFITILANPDIIETNTIIKKIFNLTKYYGVENIFQFNIVIGVCVFLILIFSIFFKALTAYIQISFVEMREYTISKRLVESYLSQPYSWFLNRHSSDLGKTVLSEVQAIIGGYLKPFMDLIAKSFIIIAILALLFLTDPKLTLFIFFYIGTAYLTIYLWLRSKLKRYGEIRSKENQSRFKILSDAFEAIKEIKIGGLEQRYLELYKSSANNFAKSKVYAGIFSQLPRYFLEAISFGGVILLILILILKKGNLNESLPIISLYVFAGYRLLPSVQSVYGSISNITFFKSSLDNIITELSNLKKYKLNKNNVEMNLKDKIFLKNICFKYPNLNKNILNYIDVTFPAKSITGLVGPTGSGKTTIIDIVLGLLEPQKGSIIIDTEIINKNNLHTWQKLIGYVPQNINLIDDSVISNIAFGEGSNEDIDIERVIKVSKIVQLHNFILNNLPNQYQTKVGERGVKLSGGQRQRIGIARALYHSPKVLVLDEATSALDDETEKEIMDTIKSLSKNLTIIMVAHRRNTIKYCDLIYKINKGQVDTYGTFEDLFKEKTYFK
jgi:ABC-type bacteriocin/lantibiotic exporter with double-glycine peptidase domain